MADASPGLSSLSQTALGDMDNSEIGDTEAGDSDWKNTFIRVYLFVCRSGGLPVVAQQQSNNSTPDSTHEQVLSISPFGLIRKRETTNDIHEYAEDHFPEWISDFSSYGGYVQRLDRLSAACVPLTEGPSLNSTATSSSRPCTWPTQFRPVWQEKSDLAFPLLLILANVLNKRSVPSIFQYF